MKQSILWMICLFLLPGFSGYSQVTQELLQGEWVAVRIVYAEKNFDNQPDTGSYFRIKFTDDILHIEGNPVINYNLSTVKKYTIKGSRILTDGETMQINSLTKDSLLLTQIGTSAWIDIRKKYYCIRRKDIISAAISQVSQDTFKANPLATPLLNTNILLQNTGAVNAYYPNGTIIKGRLCFDLRNKTITVDNINCNYKRLKMNRLATWLQSTYPHWDFTGFDNVRYIELPFEFVMLTINNITTKYAMQNFPSLTFFDTTSTTAINEKDIGRSSEEYAKGLRFSDISNWEKALEHFKKSYELNPKNADALYNMGSIYFKLGDTKAACTCYLKLRDMGQREAAKIYVQYCKEQQAAKNAPADNDTPHQ